MYCRSASFWKLIWGTKLPWGSCCQEAKRLWQKLHRRGVPWFVERIWFLKISEWCSQNCWRKGEKQGINLRLSFLRELHCLSLFQFVPDDQGEGHHWIRGCSNQNLSFFIIANQHGHQLNGIISFERNEQYLVAI